MQACFLNTEVPHRLTGLLSTEKSKRALHHFSSKKKLIREKSFCKTRLIFRKEQQQEIYMICSYQLPQKLRLIHADLSLTEITNRLFRLIPRQHLRPSCSGSSAG